MPRGGATAQRRARRSAALGLLVMGLALAACAPSASEADREAAEQCEPVLAEVQAELFAARDAGESRDEMAARFGAAIAANPDCTEALQLFAQSALASSAEADVPERAGFLGPVGWFWNTIFDRVFHGDAVMMAMFGWGLFLAPFILLFGGWAVIAGSWDAVRNPPPGPQMAEKAEAERLEAQRAGAGPETDP